MPNWEERLAAAADGVIPDDIILDDASDLSRLGVEALAIASTVVRRDRSMGSIRLIGPGVSGHSARVEDVAKVLANFQRLVLAEGAALEGHKSVRGNPPALIVSRTRLRLDGAPSAGSLKLAFVGESEPGAEIAPDGHESLFDHSERMLVDRAVDHAIGLLALAKDIGPDLDSSEFLAVLIEAGPRVAATLGDFADSLSSAGLETELIWQRPRVKRTRVKISIAELELVSQYVASRELEKEAVELRGVIHTISDISPLKVGIGPDDIVSVHATGLPKAVIGSINVGDFVVILADVTEEVAPGGVPTARYSAKSIEVIDPA